ncbi:Ribosomal RNA small subunit methyltransferase E [Austwickia sp. TVS 96-490-7B]|nr:Ribosomal RNA small subunit methyltransferase E [Austwickia sp. TVS 96-490-7B]
MHLTGTEGHHAVAVRRIRVGETILVADGSGLVAHADVTDVTREGLSARLEDIHDATPAAPRLILAQALAKNDRDEAAVETATELGVDEVLAWQARRSIVVWRGERGRKSLRKWSNIALAAAKQARRATVPLVHGPVGTQELVQRVAQVDAAYVLHEDAPTGLVEQMSSWGVDGAAIPGQVMLVVGPEGGVAPEEVLLLQEAGAIPVRLGDTVLRSSSAGPAGLSVVLAATRWRGHA